MSAYPDRPEIHGGLRDRFVSKIDFRATGECWDWHGYKRRGYGAFFIGGRAFIASRIAWEMVNGRALAKGEVVRHSCDRPSCMNPAHLLVGTQADNMRDKIERGRAVVPLLRGEKHPQSTISDADAVEIIKKVLCGGDRRALAKERRISADYISSLVRGRARGECLKAARLQLERAKP